MERAQLKKLVEATPGAWKHGGFWFLTDPAWTRGEMDGVAQLIRTGGANGEQVEGGVDEGWLCLPTGGTTGQTRFARHDERTLGAAVRGFCAHFGVGRVNAVSVLPTHHVSGLLARARSVATGGEFLAYSWKELAAGEVPRLPSAEEGWFLSLVPTQLQRLLTGGSVVADWLRSLRTIFIGGGPLWPELAERAAAERLPLAITYGMTETAAMVSALRAEEFLAGQRSCGMPLPHAAVAIVQEHDVRLPALPGVAGLVRVAGESLFRGYFPEFRAAQAPLITEDLGICDAAGALHVLGRRDAVIITGGKKVNPSEVEAVLRATSQFSDVVVIGVTDAKWGEAVVACYPRDAREPDFGEVQRRLNAELAPFKHPKRFCALVEWPANAAGKIDRAKVKAAAMLLRGDPSR